MEERKTGSPAARGRGSVGSGVWPGDRSDRRPGVNTGANEHTLISLGYGNHVIDSK